jgi:cyclopropane fatty-acyl-phospholipid synthase-like methyltransferase
MVDETHLRKMKSEDYKRFASLTFDDFRRMAQDDSLSIYEKIGFPDSYREGKEELIFKDIQAKLLNLSGREKIVLDVGPGCSRLPLMLIERCRAQGHTLLLVDSAEMLSRLPDESFIEKFPAYYPSADELFDRYAGKVDVILSYSVLHYVFAESNVWEFLDRSLALLADGGEMLIGDVPNISKRKRFFASPAGIEFHQAFTGTNEIPEVNFQRIESGHIDDAVVLSLLMRARAAGYDAYVLPQGQDLPMANRREDIFIRKP